MPLLSTAIIHLREPARPTVAASIEALLRLSGGIDSVRCFEADSMLAVRFDQAQTTLGEIVRAIEDLGPAVSGVAQRASLVSSAV